MFISSNSAVRFFLCFFVLVGSCLYGGAEAKPVRNPLYDLDASKLCSSSKLPTTAENVKFDSKSYRLVNHQHVMDELIGRYRPQYSFSSNASVLVQTLDMVAPCFRKHKAATSKKLSGKAKEQAEKKAQACYQEAYQAPELRFNKKGAEWALRRSLLRLFEAAETGSANGFVVVRDSWTIKLEGNEYNALQYVPLVDPVLDDLVLARFIRGKSSFKVFCARPEKGKDHKNSKVHFSAVTSDAPKYLQGSVNPEDDSSPISDDIVQTINTLGDERPKGAGDNDWKRQIALVQSTDEFSVGKPDYAKLGGVVVFPAKDGQTKLASDAALGLTFKKLLKYGSCADGGEGCKKMADFSFTPYFAIDLSPVEARRLTTNANNQPEEEDYFVNYAKLSAGVRVDFEKKGKLYKWHDLKDVPGRLSYSGKRRPGTKVSAVYEYFTDNFNELRGQRFGLKYSPPAKGPFSFPGYRQYYEFSNWSRQIETSGRREPKPLGLKHWLTGWSGSWDFALAYESLYYDQLGPNYKTVDPTDRQVVGGVESNVDLYGTDFEVKFTKRNMFGIPADDGWMTASVGVEYRTGYDNVVTEAAKFTSKLEFKLPETSNASVSVKYENGKDFLTLQNTNQLSVDFGLRF